MQWDPLVVGAGILGSAIIGAMVYSFEAGGEEREIVLKIQYLTEHIERIDKELNKRMDALQYEYRGYGGGAYPNKP
jgi:hypothetical protein